ncbi:MAG: IS3 family transposase [Myxococcota bacterium]
MVEKLRRADVLLGQGQSVAQAVQALEVTEQTYYRWRREYGGTGRDQVKRMKELELENSRLKRIVADQALDLAMAKDGDRGKSMTTTRKRDAVRRLGQLHPAASERRRCRVVGVARSVLRYRRRQPGRDAALSAELQRLALKHPRFGYRRMNAILLHQGWRVNQKRVARVWRESGLKVPKRKLQRRRLGHSANGILRYRAMHPNHVWTYDFVSDQTEDGRRLKLLVVMDEFTREVLTIRCGRSCTGMDVVDALAALFRLYGVPEHIRSDNGPEFIAKAVRGFLERMGVVTLFIEPGSPWENGYIESFNARFRDEFLDRELLHDLREARLLIETWRIEYNTVRPHGSLGQLPPVIYAAKIREGQINA